jgi:hypothetical protein
MNLNQEKLIEFAKEYELLLERKKDVAADLKDYVEVFCDENDIKKKKPLINAVKAFLQWQKDRAKFLEESNETDVFIDILTGEKCIESPVEEE